MQDLQGGRELLSLDVLLSSIYLLYMYVRNIDLSVIKTNIDTTFMREFPLLSQIHCIFSLFANYV